jgi:hypothetical protein
VGALFFGGVTLLGVVVGSRKGASRVPKSSLDDVAPRMPTKRMRRAR